MTITDKDLNHVYENAIFAMMDVVKFHIDFGNFGMIRATLNLLEKLTELEKQAIQELDNV